MSQHLNPSLKDFIALPFFFFTVDEYGKAVSCRLMPTSIDWQWISGTLSLERFRGKVKTQKRHVPGSRDLVALTEKVGMGGVCHR